MQTRPPFRSVLLVDDNPIENRLNRKTILQSGFSRYAYIHTQTGAALEFLKNLLEDDELGLQIAPDFIFLDLNMPRQGGQSFLEEFARMPEALRNKTKIVTLTGETNPQEILRITQLPHVYRYIPKPLTPKHLEEILEQENNPKP